MKFFVVSDTHGGFDFPDIMADAILLLGDISSYEINKIDSYYPHPKFAVFGNNDTIHHFNGTSIQNIHEKVVDFYGIKLTGFGGIPKYSNKNSFYEFAEKEVSNFVDSIVESKNHIDIFLAHANPMWIPNFDYTDPNRGFRSFTRAIEQLSPDYFLHGHLHESNQKTYEKTNIVSVYPTFSFEI